MKKSGTVLKNVAGAVLLLGFAGFVSAARAQVAVKVLDKTYDVGAGAFAYTEWELSGEPLAEALGLDLKALKPDVADMPDPFDYAAGIDSYEYSEEAMFALNYKSQLGPHVVNGPANAKRGGTMQSLGQRVIQLAKAAGYSPDELPLNMYPITFPLDKGLPEFGQAVDATPVSTDQITIRTHKGQQESVKTFTPRFFRDYKTLAWRKSGADMATTPLAIGGEMLKDVMWAQDFLSGLHATGTNQEIDDPPNAAMAHDGKHGLGKADDDGMNGLLLTEITWDKLLTLRDQFGYDGTKLGAPIVPNYDARRHPVWLPNKVAVTLTTKNGVNALGGLKVVDGGSSLRGTWTMLWALAEMYGFSDQRTANTNQRKAFSAVFDGVAFPSAPQANRGVGTASYVKADDPFSLAATLANLEMQNLDVLHFNAKAGTFVGQWANGKQGDSVRAYDAAYSIVALQVYQRALEALPVGYASAAAGKPIASPAAKRAGELIKAQSDFILNQLIGKNGLVADSYTIGRGASAEQGLDSQFAAIRGLAAAFTATGDEKYRTAARKIYLAVDARMFDKSAGIFDPTPGKAFVATPWTAGAVSAGLRELMTTLASRESESEEPLTLASLSTRYTDWFDKVGRSMQLAEWLNDSGEHMAVDGDADVNRNGVKVVTKAGGQFGTAAVMAARIMVTPGH